MSIKSSLKSLLSLLEHLFVCVSDAIFRALFWVAIKTLDLKEGNIYSPSWAPKSWTRIIGIQYPYIVYIELRPHPNGGHYEPGACSQPDPFGFWIENTFIKHSPVELWEVTIRDRATPYRHE